MNKAISEQVYPDTLKIAKVLPIYKAGEKSSLNNYRPISILPTINKIFEKILHSQLTQHIERNNIMFGHQYGFRKFHNTTHALISSYDYIVEHINNKDIVMGLFIDLRKAFDSINHKILVKKLTYYGINGPFNKIITDYLNGRKIFTQISSTRSELLPIKYGVPQGSVLGPLLFILFINDIKYLRGFDLKLFADDTNLFIHSKDLISLEQKANTSLKIFNNWLLSNKLSLNCEKTHYLPFANQSKEIENSQLNINIGNQHIQRKLHTKFLGLHLQDNLKWDIHINNVIKKMNSTIPLFINTRHFLSISQLIQVYSALVFSKYNYGIEIYGNCSKFLMANLQTTQNRLLKIISSKNKRKNK